MRKILFLASVAAIAYGAFIYASTQPMNVSELNNNAEKYDGSKITVQGRVTKNLTILGKGGYLLSDDNSSILVFSNTGTPKNDTHTTITGQFTKAISLGSLEYNTITITDD